MIHYRILKATTQSIKSNQIYKGKVLPLVSLNCCSNSPHNVLRYVGCMYMCDGWQTSNWFQVQCCLVLTVKVNGINFDDNMLFRNRKLYYSLNSCHKKPGYYFKFLNIYKDYRIKKQKANHKNITRSSQEDSTCGICKRLVFFMYHYVL